MTLVETLAQMLVLLMLMGAALAIPMKMALPRRTCNVLKAFLLRDLVGWVGHKVLGPPTVRVQHGRRRRRYRRLPGHRRKRRRR